MKNLIASFLLITLALASCSQTKDMNPNGERPEMNSQNNRPQPQGDQMISSEALFKRFDQNGDLKLAKSEIEGPLLNDFDKVDTNNDGFISMEELEKAPKPRPRQRPGN